MTTPEIVQLLSFGLTDAALFVFSIFAYKAANRRDSAFVKSLADMNARAAASQNQFVEALTKLQADNSKSLESTHQNIVNTAKDSHAAVVSILATTQSKLESNSAAGLSALLEQHKANITSHEKIQESAAKAAEVVASAARVSSVAAHGKALWDKDARKVVRVKASE